MWILLTIARNIIGLTVIISIFFLGGLCLFLRLSSTTRTTTQQLQQSLRILRIVIGNVFGNIIFGTTATTRGGGCRGRLGRMILIFFFFWLLWRSPRIVGRFFRRRDHCDGTGRRFRITGFVGIIGQTSNFDVTPTAILRTTIRLLR